MQNISVETDFDFLKLSSQTADEILHQNIDLGEILSMYVFYVVTKSYYAIVTYTKGDMTEYYSSSCIGRLMKVLYLYHARLQYHMT